MRLPPWVLALLFLLAIAATPGCSDATATTAPPGQAPAGSAEETLDDFEVSNEYLLLFADQPQTAAALYLSQRDASFLVLAPDLPHPLLLRARTGEVVKLDSAAIRHDAASATVPGTAHLGVVSKLVAADDGVVFSINGRVHRLRSNALIGEHTQADLYQHSPEYRAKAAAYRPDTGPLAELRALERAVVVRVVFASWCHVCKTYLPNLLRVADELAGSRIRFEYVGLPDWKHPEVQRLSV